MWLTQIRRERIEETVDYAFGICMKKVSSASGSTNVICLGFEAVHQLQKRDDLWIVSFSSCQAALQTF